MIKCQTPFGMKTWKKHKNSSEHCRRITKGNTRITSFFKTKCLPKTQLFKMTDLIQSNHQQVRLCKGIFDTRNGQDKYLELMVTYGSFSDLKIIITKRCGLIGAFVDSCNNQSFFNKSRAYYKDACKFCFESLQLSNSDAKKFI